MTAVYFCPQVPWSPIKTLSDQGPLCGQLIYSPRLTGTGCPEQLKSLYSGTKHLSLLV